MKIEAFITLVLIVFGILQIILFFKIWGMTNHIKEMRDFFLREEDSKRKEKEQAYYFNEGEQVIYKGKTYEILENLSRGMCKCKDVEKGSYHSLPAADLELIK